MKEIINKKNAYFEEMLSRGLVSTGSLWIEKAVVQKNHHMPLAVADSRLLTYDRIDQRLLKMVSFN